MNTTLLSAVELVLLAAGALGALRFTRWIAREAGRGVILMAAVTAWVILFGIIPFFAFALFAPGAGSPAGHPSTWETFVLNLIPFALVAAPLAGFVNGMKVSRTSEKQA